MTDAFLGMVGENRRFEMALSDGRYGGASEFEAALPAAEPRPARAALTTALLRRLALLLSCALASVAVLLLAEPSGVQSADPDLARLLKGMAIIKTALLVLAGSAIWWRLGWPIGSGLAAGYILSATVAAAGAALVWSLTGLAFAPFLFDGGLLAFLILSLRDDNGPWLRALARMRSRRVDPNA
jgi:hypothetical protein